MSSISSRLRQQVIERANDRCEYCGLSQKGQAATFHIDHVIPIAAQGQTDLENLALACVSCSLRKSARLSALDPLTNRYAPIFNPRKQAWYDHFRWDGVYVIGLTPKSLPYSKPIAISLSKSQPAGVEA